MPTIFSGRLVDALAEFQSRLVGRHDWGQAVLGFTGSREGPTEEQKATWEKMTIWLSGIGMHNGCAVGSDRYVLENLPAVSSCSLWPANLDGSTWAKDFAKRHLATEILPILSPLDRNKYIVSHSHGLIAFPSTDTEVLRSGTWATIRYARKTKKPVLYVLPSGMLAF